MSKTVTKFLNKEFADAYYWWLESSIELAKSKNDTISFKSLEEAKNLYFSDYMHSYFTTCAEIATAMVNET